jgi:hypothetical protein
MGLLDSLIDLVSPNSLEDQRKRLEQGRSRTYIRGEQSRLPVSAPKAPARLPKATAQPSSTTLQIKELGKQYRAGRVNQQDFNNRLNALTSQVNQDWRAGLDKIDSAMLNNPNELLTGYSLSGRKVEGAAGDLSRNVVRPLVGGFAETNWVRPVGALAQLATQNKFGAGLANYGDTSNSTFSGRYDTNYGSKLIRGGAGLASDMAVTLGVPGGSWAVGAKHGLNEANDQFQGALDAGYGVGDAYMIAIPAGITQGAISKYLTGKLGNRLQSNFAGNITTNLIKRGAASFGTEAAEEGLQQLSSNAFRNLYDPNQGLTDGVVEIGRAHV